MLRGTHQAPQEIGDMGHPEFAAGTGFWLRLSVKLRRLLKLESSTPFLTHPHRVTIQAVFWLEWATHLTQRSVPSNKIEGCP
jgi:hypothetical protein